MRCQNRGLYFSMFRVQLPCFHDCLWGSIYPLSGYTIQGVQQWSFLSDSNQISLVSCVIRYTS